MAINHWCRFFIKQIQLLLNERLLFPSTFELFNNGEMLNIADKKTSLI